MPIKFLVHCHSPETGAYLKEVVAASRAGTIVAEGDLKRLPALNPNSADVILLEYQEDNPELDRWIERATADAKGPAIFLFFPDICTSSLWKALRLGARECFGYPVKEEEFQEAVTRVTLRAAHRGRRSPAILSFLGCKGGAGTSFLASSTAAILAREEQEQVLLVDLDLQYGQLSHFFDLQPKLTLADMVNHGGEMDLTYLQSLLYSRGQHLQILPAPSRPEEGETIAPQHLEKLLAQAKKLPGFGWIIIDVGHRINEVTLKVVELSDRVVMVATPTIPALTNGKKILELFRLLGLERLTVDLWLNCWQKEEDLTLKEVSQFLGREVSGTIRFENRQVARSINEGRPLVETAPRQAVCQDVAALVHKLKGEEPAAKDNARSWSWLRRLGSKK